MHDKDLVSLQTAKPSYSSWITPDVIKLTCNVSKGMSSLQCLQLQSLLGQSVFMWISKSLLENSSPQPKLHFVLLLGHVSLCTWVLVNIANPMNTIYISCRGHVSHVDTIYVMLWIKATYRLCMGMECKAVDCADNTQGYTQGNPLGKHPTIKITKWFTLLLITLEYMYHAMCIYIP